MTGKQLKNIRKASGLTLKNFYEKKLGLSYYTMGLNAEKSYAVPKSIIQKLEANGIVKKTDHK